MAGQGDTNANRKTPTFKGTICCRVNKGGDEYLLTCSHVVTGGTSNNFFGPITPAPANIQDAGDGNYTWATCSDQFDIALIKPTNHTFNYKIPLQKERPLSPADILATDVKVVCRDNTVKQGTVINNKSLDPISIGYKNGDHSIRNLIIISKVTTGPDGENVYANVTVPGDSGACVYDGENRPIGMIVAGNNKFSYAIPIVDILNRLTATII